MSDSCPFCTDRKLTKLDDLRHIMQVAYDRIMEAQELYVEISNENLLIPKEAAP